MKWVAFSSRCSRRRLFSSEICGSDDGAAEAAAAKSHRRPLVALPHHHFRLDLLRNVMLKSLYSIPLSPTHGHCGQCCYIPLLFLHPFLPQSFLLRFVTPCTSARPAYPEPTSPSVQQRIGSPEARPGLLEGSGGLAMPPGPPI